LNYFQIEISNKMDFYIDNIVAYISFDVVWISFTTLLLIYYLLYFNKYFDWNREYLLLKHDNLREKLFWTHKTQFLCNLFLITSCYWRLYFSVSVILKIIFKIIIPIDGYYSILFWFFVICILIDLIFWIQFNFAYYKFHWRKNKEYILWK
jgi:hypothetical protein